MKKILKILCCLLLCSSACLAVKTELASFESSSDGSIDLSYNTDGARYQLFVADEHIVNTCLISCRSGQLKKLSTIFLRSVDKANALKAGQSQDMGKVELDGGEFHFIAHRDQEQGPWIQIMVFSSNDVDTIGFGIFGDR